MRRLAPVWAGLAMACQPGSGAAPQPPNVLLITVESLRPDHVGFQAGPRDTTPVLDTLAAEAMVYEDAHAVTSWTLTSHASLFTGLYPTAHQVVRPLDRLGDAYDTLAEMLGRHGYQTAGVVSGPYLQRAHNLHQGFERYDDTASASTQVDAHGDVTNPAMLRSLVRFLREERDPERPFFLFAYFWDPHYDYIPPEPYDRAFREPGDVPVEMRGYGRLDHVNARSSPQELSYVLSQYDGEILWTDAALGRLFGVLRDQGLWEDTLVIVTADHGEEFFEHGWKGHKNNLFVESVHVPLLVRYPGGPSGRDDRLVSLVDLLPTIAEVTGARTAQPQHGRSLLEAEPDSERAIFFELYSVWYFETPEGQETPTRPRDWQAIRQGDHKLVGIPEHRMYLFDVRTDPREQVDLLAPGPGAHPRGAALLERLATHRSEMQQLAHRFEAGGAAALEPDALERLRSLGYLK